MTHTNSSRAFQRLPAVVLSATLFILASPAFADAGIPMIACISPGLWLLLPAVIVVESVIALFVLRRGLWTALKVATVSNLFSSLVGMPLTSLVVWALSPAGHRLMERMYNHGADLDAAWNSSTLFQKFAVSVMGVIGAGPDKGTMLRIWLCWGLLLIPFFLLSVLSEWWVAKLLLKKEDKRLARRWAWIANGVSYISIYGSFHFLFAFTWRFLDPLAML